MDVTAVVGRGQSKAYFDELGRAYRTDLVGAMQILLQERRLKIAPTLPLAPTPAGELHQFQVRAVSLAADAAIEWRERPHDDLVLAIAIAVWLAEQPSGFVYRLN